MVKPERYNLKGHVPANIAQSACQATAKTLERAKNGTWRVVLEVEVSFELRDGRTVLFQRQVRIQGRQEGARPNPNAFGRRKKKGTRK